MGGKIMSEKTYHGLTLLDIKDKYYIRYQGHEEQRDMYDINSKLAEYWQEVSYYYVDSKRQLDGLEDTLRRFTADYEAEVEDNKARYLRESLSMPKGKRWSDKARETLAISDAMTSDKRRAFKELNDLINTSKDEVNLWHEVRNNMRFISKRVDNDSMNMAVEAKITRNYSVQPSDTAGEKKKAEVNITPVAIQEDDDFFLGDTPLMEEEKDEKMKEYCKKVGITDPETEVPF